jgi:hypothetical protein
MCAIKSKGTGPETTVHSWTARSNDDRPKIVAGARMAAAFSPRHAGARIAQTMSRGRQMILQRDKVLKALIGSLAVVGVASVLGCASIQLPPNEVASFDASLLTAKQVGVEHVPSDRAHRGGLGMSPAKEHLILANDQAAVAKELAAAGDRRAEFFLARAQSDLDLAVALALQASAHADAACSAGLCPPIGRYEFQSASAAAPIWTAIR